MAGCVNSHEHDHAQHINDKRILWIAFALNFPLFVLEVWQGMAADSTSLLADSMDFLSDSFSYLITLVSGYTGLNKRSQSG
jgi:Co/Zn/Cd efflux system component